MLKYTLNRFLIAIPTIFLVITISFFMMRFAPGSPFDSDRPLPPEVRANVLKSFNMDKPLFNQYLDYLYGVAKFDFGASIKQRDYTVSELIFLGFPVSLRLGLVSIIVAILFGCSLGISAALNKNSFIDYLVMSFAMTGIMIPNFVMAPILALFFGIYLNVLPVGGWSGGKVQNMVLPVIALSLPQIAYIARLTRASMIEVLSSNYIRTAKAKGIGKWAVINRHSLKGALLPVVSYLGPATAGIITGSVVIESIFNIPGIGRYFVNAALNRDYPMVMGVVIFYACIIITLNFFVDIAYGFLDPKIKVSQRR